MLFSIKLCIHLYHQGLGERQAQPEPVPAASVGSSYTTECDQSHSKIPSLVPRPFAGYHTAHKFHEFY